MSESVAPESLTYREASVELEQIVRSLEGGDLELEEALEAYERGSLLLRSLRERLAEADQKVRTILDENEGGTRESALPDATSAPMLSLFDDEE